MGVETLRITAGGAYSFSASGILFGKKHQPQRQFGLRGGLGFEPPPVSQRPVNGRANRREDAAVNRMLAAQQSLGIKAEELPDGQRFTSYPRTLSLQMHTDKELSGFMGHVGPHPNRRRAG